jgi:hypothetical protein
MYKRVNRLQGWSGHGGKEKNLRQCHDSLVIQPAA